MIVRLTAPRVLHALLGAAVALSLGSCAAPRPAASSREGGGTVVAAAPASPARSVPPVLVPQPPPANLGTVERFAWQAVTQMAEALVSGDAAGFLSRVSRGFYHGYTALESALQEIIGSTATRKVVVAVQGVETDGDRVSVRAKWTRSFRGRDGSVEESYGETVFLFLKSDTTLRLLDYKGDPVFGIAGI